MKVDLNELRIRVGQKLLTEQKHPEADLIIWNYTPKAQYSKTWDEYTTMCRGLITDLEGNVVARPFPKFFNLNETPETSVENLPAEVPEVTEKMDGSLGILYKVNGKARIATRGSFSSEQAKWATKWLNDNYANRAFLEGYTYLFEIIYRENRIVVDYGKREELVLLAMIENETGREVGDLDLLGFSLPKSYSGTIEYLASCAEYLEGNDEGFVCRYSNGLRVKIKGKEYVRLHRLITGFSSKSIWECLRDGTNIEEMLERVPDEFYQWVASTRKDLQSKFDSIKEQVSKEFLAVTTELEMVYGDGTGVLKDVPRKEWALRIQKTIYPKLLFALIDSRPFDDMIWRMIQPKYELPFRKDEDA